MKRILLSVILAMAISLPTAAQITVISGEQIKPEKTEQKKPPVKETTDNTSGTHDGGEAPVVKSRKITKVKKVKRDSGVVSGKAREITIAAITAVHSKLSEEGDLVLFEVAEGSAGLSKGTMAIGKITDISNKSLTIKMQQLVLGGRTVALDGEVKVLAKSGGASIIPGEKFSTKLGKGDGGALLFKEGARPKYKKLSKEIIIAEIVGAAYKTKFGKGKLKGDIVVLVEPPKGKELKIFKEDAPLSLVKINDRALARVVNSGPKVKEGDYNENSIVDRRYVFAAWDVVKYLKPGSNKLSFLGILADGQAYQLNLSLNYIIE